MIMATHSLLLGVALLWAIRFSSAAAVFESIDCGSDQSYLDDNGINWKRDSDLIKTGVPQKVQLSNGISHVMDTLRVFTSRNKNCYNVSVNKGEKILVRARFFYGNYDLKSSPPTFDIHYDGNYWSTVSTSSTESYTFEVIYIPKGNATSVCVAQTKPNQFPFISTLEVRSLTSEMYSSIDPDYALYTRVRTAYGTNTEVRYTLLIFYARIVGTAAAIIRVRIRYPQDNYDRLWFSKEAESGFIKVASDETTLDLTKVWDDAPKEVLLSAATTTGSKTMEFLSNFVTDDNRIYFNLYFSEVKKLTSSQKRSFAVYKDDVQFSDVIVPPYGSGMEIYTNYTLATADTIFSLVATTDSTLPPIVNAAEVFAVRTKLTDGTDSSDVDGLAALQYSVNGFEVLQEWRGDPCLPDTYSWEWITCTKDIIPRVTALNLRSFGLEGSLPDFSSMNALEKIDLSNNSLSGDIPAFLGTLPNLKELNLADNKFSGGIPDSLIRNGKLKLVLTGNPDLCVSANGCETSGGGGPHTQGGSPTKKKMSSTVRILGVIIGCLVLAVLVGVGLFLYLRKRPANLVPAQGQSGGGGNNFRNGGSGNPNGPPQQNTINSYTTTGSELEKEEHGYPIDQQARIGMCNDPDKAIIRNVV